MRKRLIFIGATLTLLAIASAQQADHFPDTPDNHWAYQAMADLHSVGLAYALPEFIGRGNRPQSRYEFAVGTHAVTTLLRRAVLRLESTNRAIAGFSGAAGGEAKALTESKQADIRYVSSLHAILGQLETDVCGLEREFSPELRKLGVDPTEMAAQSRRDFQKIANFRSPNLGEATRQFADVPANHWAASAILDLRTAGILHGSDGIHFNDSKSLVEPSSLQPLP